MATASWFFLKAMRRNGDQEKFAMDKGGSNKANIEQRLKEIDARFSIQ